MQRRILGKTQLEVSVLGFGAAGIGYLGANAPSAGALLNAVLDSGINLIDTAECYGESEELIGQAVSHRRNEFHLMSKCGHAYGLDYNDWDPVLLQRTIERSLQRLKTDHLDLLQLHSCSEKDLRKGDVIEVLQRAQSAGKTRFVGYSGDSRAALYAVECGAFDTLQTSVNIADQEAIQLTIARAQEKGLGVIAKRSVANVAWRFSQAPPDGFVLPYWERLQQLRYDFLAERPEEILRTALSFTLSIPGVHTALVGTVNSDHLRGNLRGAAPLSESEYRSIRDRWLAVAGPDWTAASELRGRSIVTRIKESIRRIRRALKGPARSRWRSYFRHDRRLSRGSPR